MLISRASMQKQLKGNKMKNIKKPVLKKNVGKLLETFSPAYSIMKGKGPTSQIASAIGKAAGPMSPIGQLAQDRRKEGQRRRAEMLGSNRMTEMPRMMAGGPVKRNRSIDGCAVKGKTRA